MDHDLAPGLGALVVSFSPPWLGRGLEPSQDGGKHQRETPSREHEPEK